MKPGRRNKSVFVKRASVGAAAMMLALTGGAFAQAQQGAQQRPSASALTREDQIKPPMVESTERLAVTRAGGAHLRALDKIDGATTDLQMADGETVQFGRLNVQLSECREPKNDPESDAFAELTITDREKSQQLFAGWMVASSPSLSAMDDARYDVWVVSCTDGSKTGAGQDLEYVPEPEGPVEGGEGADENPDGQPAPESNDDTGGNG